MIVRRDQTVAYRMRQAFRAGKLPKRVEPKSFPPPVAALTSQTSASTTPVGSLGRFAAPEPFASKQGLPVEFIRSLVAQGKLTHIELPGGEVMISVAQGEKEIDALAVKRAPIGTAINTV